MTDTREKLETLYSELRMDEYAAANDVTRAGQEVAEANRDAADRLRAILDAMPEGPGLPWVSVDARMPAKKDGDSDECVWWATNSDCWKSWRYDEDSAITATHWCPTSAVPLPTDSGWIDAGVWGAAHVGVAWAAVVTVPEPGTYRVMVKPVEGREDG